MWLKTYFFIKYVDRFVGFADSFPVFLSGRKIFLVQEYS